MADLATLAISVSATALATYVVTSLIRRKHDPKKRVRCSSTYCAGLLAHTASGLTDLEVRADGQRLTNPVIVTYAIESIGNCEIKDCRISVRASQSDSIFRWNFYVDNEIKCQRLHVEATSEKTLQFKWDFINPGDRIELVLLVAPCADPKCIEIGIDAEGTKVDYRGMRLDCRPSI